MKINSHYIFTSEALPILVQLALHNEGGREGCDHPENSPRPRRHRRHREVTSGPDNGVQTHRPA